MAKPLVPPSRRPLTGPQMKAAQNVARVLRVADLARSSGAPKLARDLDAFAAELRSRTSLGTEQRPPAPGGEEPLRKASGS